MGLAGYRAALPRDNFRLANSRRSEGKKQARIVLLCGILFSLGNFFNEIDSGSEVAKQANVFIIANAHPLIF